jgi:hypothetical protein
LGLVLKREYKGMFRAVSNQGVGECEKGGTGLTGLVGLIGLTGLIGSLGVMGLSLPYFPGASCGSQNLGIKHHQGDVGEKRLTI